PPVEIDSPENGDTVPANVDEVVLVASEAVDSPEVDSSEFADVRVPTDEEVRFLFSMIQMLSDGSNDLEESPANKK
ncbi:MAG: hypothetical protein KDA47_11910, partial [Planctomycetales bacterium]|nr:hypothetical protein [Planctomycetales bacterium]